MYTYCIHLFDLLVYFIQYLLLGPFSKSLALAYFLFTSTGPGVTDWGFHMRLFVEGEYLSANCFTIELLANYSTIGLLVLS